MPAYHALFRWGERQGWEHLDILLGVEEERCIHPRKAVVADFNADRVPHFALWDRDGIGYVGSDDIATPFGPFQRR